MKKLTKYTFALLLCYLLGLGPSLALAAGAGAAGMKKAPEPARPPVGRSSLGPPRRAPSPQTPTVGQASTLLPDGRTLVTGGRGAEGPQSAVFVVEPGGTQTVLGSELRSARAYHTATLLPDGRVLVVGGVGPNGRVVSAAEIYDPQAQSSEPLALPWPGAARAYHTATLLTDGRVLFVGGVMEAGGAAGGAELWDFRTRRATALRARPNVARQRHKATLLESGAVLIAGGADEEGNEASSAELFNPEDGFSFTAGAPAADPETAYVSASIPGNDETGVATDALLSLRFSRPLRVETVNGQTVTVNGPQGPIAVKVVPAEGGRLAFVTPLPSLSKGTTYTLSVAGASDGTGTVTPFTVSFTTAGKRDGGGVTEEDWVPDERNFRGNWRSNRVPETPAMSLPPLQAPEGVTALSGQVLTLTGQPLADVTFRVGDVATRSDSTGRFLLSELPAGHHVMVMDGRTASSAKKRYGIFKVGVDVVGGQTSRLGYTVWMPKLDAANAVALTSPTVSDTVVTSPRIPGLELRLPAGTAIRDMDGATVTELSITPIPTNQPPFPLPAGVDVPVYFTVQPGGAAVIPPRAQLVYPNFMGAAAGARIDFYNYDATEKGWYVYGRGTVTHDRRQIVPDAGVVLYEFSGAMIASPSTAPPEGPEPCNEGCEGGDPVDLSTGLFVHSVTDLYVRDTLPVSITRTYRPRDTISRAFGIGSTQPYDIFLIGDTFPYTYQELILPDGGRVRFNRVSPGTSYTDAVYEDTSSPSSFYKSRLSWNGNGWDLKLKDGTTYIFPEAFGVARAVQSALVGMRDRHGNSYTLTRDSNRNLTKITTPNKRYVEFTYDASNRITQAKDSIGRTVGYTYDATGRLWKVTDVNGGVTEYGYDSSHRMTTIKDPKGVTIITNGYDTSGRVIKQTMADATTYLFAYAIGTNGRIAQADVTDQRGVVRRVTMNSDGYMLTDTYGLGKPEQQTVTYERDATNNQVLSVTDGLGRRTAYGYDALGNLTSVTKLAGTPGAATTSYTYEPTYQLPATVTDALNHTTTYGYDSLGNLTSVTDALNSRATLTYNAAGQITSITDPLQHTTSFAYEGGDLVAVTDPEGNTTTRFVDDAGRVLSMTDALGRSVKYEYDKADRVTRTVGADGAAAFVTYDANGNVLTLTDARGQVTAFTYNNVNRLVSRKDPLLKVESYEYDAAGNLTKFTDRRGKLTTYTYDSLGRPTFVGYGAVIPNKGATTYESTATATYDAVGRLTRVVDSAAGTYNLGYDSLSRLTSESGPQGAISYTYDAVGRQTSMTVAGQPAVSYVYDNANRLTGITQGSSAVGFQFDAANRPTTLTLPNGVVGEYAYDRNSNVTGIKYTKGAALVGDISYVYDAANRRVRAGGSLSGMNLPQATSGLSYDAANRLTSVGGATLTYDANGNLTGDGANTYTWNARNQLVSISGAVSASFAYDPFGRRARKTVGGTTTDYLYDALNVVQELSGGAPTANMLTGGVDSVYTRTDSAGTRTFVNDGSGSTRALLDADGSVLTRYTYDPFGNTTADGEAGGNPSQFTGRDNDGTGLYYYRARYYSPKQQRFISEDPIGHAGGLNLYAYVENDPVNWTDPLGLEPEGNSWLDKLQLGLDIGGLIPGLGEPLDFINGLISVGRGDYYSASLSMAAMLPVGGQAATAGKIAGRLPRHHIFPQRRDLAKQFKNAGIKIHKHTIELPEALHKACHAGGPRGGAWNKAWEDFFQNNPNATAEDIYKQAGKMIYEFGIDGRPVVPYK